MCALNIVSIEHRDLPVGECMCAKCDETFDPRLPQHQISGQQGMEYYTWIECPRCKNLVGSDGKIVIGA